MNSNKLEEIHSAALAKVSVGSLASKGSSKINLGKDKEVSRTRSVTSSKSLISSLEVNKGEERKDKELHRKVEIL